MAWKTRPKGPRHFDAKSFAYFLAHERAISGLTLRDVANATRVAPSTILRCERGHVPDVETFLRLLKWLGVSSHSFRTKAGGAR